MSVFFVLLGIVLLYLGGEFLVRNAVSLAARLGVSSLVIGLTVVAFGTSAPELAATLVSAFQGVPDIAIGNVVGSNIANVGLILGLTAAIYPLQASLQFIRREIPVTVAIGALLFPVMAGGLLGRIEGMILLALLGGYLWYLFRSDDPPLLEELEPEVEPGALPPLWRSLLGVAVGVALLVFGARALVEGAVTIATSLGVPERVIGLTLVAFGTSLPELASSLVAALRREADLILGNIIGSNIFNVLAVLGATALIRPIPVDLAATWVDIAIMLAFSLVLLPMMTFGYRLGRKRGTTLVIAYAAYVVVLFG